MKCIKYYIILDIYFLFLDMSESIPLWHCAAAQSLGVVRPREFGTHHPRHECLCWNHCVMHRAEREMVSNFFPLLPISKPSDFLSCGSCKEFGKCILRDCQHSRWYFQLPSSQPSQQVGERRCGGLKDALRYDA